MVAVAKARLVPFEGEEPRSALIMKHELRTNRKAQGDHVVLCLKLHTQTTQTFHTKAAHIVVLEHRRQQRLVRDRIVLLRQWPVRHLGGHALQRPHRQIRHHPAHVRWVCTSCTDSMLNVFSWAKHSDDVLISAEVGAVVNLMHGEWRYIECNHRYIDQLPGTQSERLMRRSSEPEMMVGLWRAGTSTLV